MIDPRELRLGNFVKTIVQAYPRFSDKVESIVSIELISKDYCICKDTLEINGVVVSNDYHQKNLSELKPIPLTEDILLKCGFEKKEYSKGDYNKREYCYYNSEEDIYLSLGFELLYESFDDCHDTFYLYESSRKINSLHLLQNYIYFKTEKELEVKL